MIRARVDETYIQAECRRGNLPPPNLLVKGQWKYLYRAVDSQGNTLDFLLSAKRDAKAAERFLCKTLNATHTQTPQISGGKQPRASAPAALKRPLHLNC